jgi:site-specific recombinase XerD
MAERLSISGSFELYRTDYIVMTNRSPKTEESYRGTCKLLLRRFGDVPLDTLSFEAVRDWRNWLCTWQSNDTVRGNIICLRMVLKFMGKRGFPVMNYDEIPVAKREKRIIKYLNHDEMEAFIQEVGKPRRGYTIENKLRNVAIVRLLYATGLRNSELVALNRDSIKNRTFTVIGKSRDPRIGFIDASAELAIKQYLDTRLDKEKALFVSPQTGKRMTSDTLRKIFQNICERSEFDGVHPHTIRHSFATRLLEKRVDLRYVGDLMGHVDLNTTRLYTHYSNPKLMEIYNNAVS